ncbi:hypothetical protein [Peribacillus simplex]|uniref:hypothetical protein n=1 Tax=Peribacillus simplex TaxID=1478 RepID=UPI000BA7E208|nr:hypothetical protein [Peribacillus simplex]PAK41078.1 hypothetical protein CHI08_13315 [Peribacillus simplex]
MDQIKNEINTYTFFLETNRGKRELYVGKMTNIYDIGDITPESSLLQYIPDFYIPLISIPNVFVEVMTIFKIDSTSVTNIIIESTRENILSAKRNSVFLVNINEELEKLLNELLSNPEVNFQYQVEQEDVPDDVTVDDQPKDKPSRTSGSGTSSYKKRL